jgi:hypothetical protein
MHMAPQVQQVDAMACMDHKIMMSCSSVAMSTNSPDPHQAVWQLAAGTPLTARCPAAAALQAPLAPA